MLSGISVEEVYDCRTGACQERKGEKTYSFAIIEKYDSYARAGDVITLDGVLYVIMSNDHGIVGGGHFDKLEFRKVN